MAKKFGKLYLDTDILRRFDFDIHKDPRYANLKARLLLSGVYIPRIVFEEWFMFYKKVLNEHLSGLKNKVDDINKYVASKINLDFPDTTILEKELSERLLSNLKAAGIEIFENHFDSINLSTIADMAIHKVKPFQEQGKGFKDVLILFSIIEDCKYDMKSAHIFLTGNKTDFDNDNIKNLISKEKIDLNLFFSLENLIEFFDKLIDKTFKGWLDKRNGAIRNLLLEQKDKIMDFIQQKGQFDEWFLKEGISHFVYSIEAIKGVEFVDVFNQSASFLDEGQIEGDVDIYCSIKLKFILSITKSTYETPKFKIGETMVKSTGTALSRLLSTTEEFDVYKDIIVKGKMHIKKEGTKELFEKEIQIEEIAVYGSPLQKALFGSGLMSD